jgi:CRP-like cAMP-binding protein
MDKSTIKPGHLRRIKSLALLNDEQLAAFLDYVEVVSCALNSTLFREGELGDFMFFILEGEMRVYLKQKSGEVMGLRLLAAGDAFGEVGLMTEAKRSANVEAVTNCTLIKVTSASLQRLIAEQPAMAAQFLYHQARILGRQLTDLTTQLRARREQADVLAFLQ